MLTNLELSHPHGGLFSCCSVKLTSIIEFYKINLIEPIINYDNLFSKYAVGNLNNIFFECSNLQPTLNYNDIFDFNVNTQFNEYKNIEFNKANKWIQKYFSPSQTIKDRINYFYQIYPKFKSNNICSIFYRGNDKITEIPIPSYNQFIDKAKILKKQESNIIFHIQTDELEFQQEFSAIFPNSFFCKEIPMINRSMTSVSDTIPKIHRLKFAIDFLSIVYILSKSKYLITHSGNCGLWAVLLRGNYENVHQNLLNHWI